MARMGKANVNDVEESGAEEAKHPHPEPNVVPPEPGIPADTNPENRVGETYQQYHDRILTEGKLLPASEAEWANAVEVDPNAPEVEETTSPEDEEADLEEHLQELEGDEDNGDDEGEEQDG